MLKLIVNPQKLNHFLFMEYLVRKFDNLPFIEIILTNKDIISLYDGNELIACSIDELFALFNTGEKIDDTDEEDSNESPLEAIKRLQEEERREESHEEEFERKKREFDSSKTKLKEPTIKSSKMSLNRIPKY